jgi:hypothetical protein
MRVLLLMSAAAAAVAAACGDTNAPPSPNLAGTYAVIISRLDSGGALNGTVAPSPFSLKVVQNGNALSDSFPTLVWSQATGGSWSFPPGEPNDQIVGHGDTLTWSAYSTADAGGKTCTLVLRGLVVSDSVHGSVLVSGTATACAVANGGTWAGKRQ